MRTRNVQETAAAVTRDKGHEARKPAPGCQHPGKKTPPLFQAQKQALPLLLLNLKPGEAL